jgi:ferric-dicitrate binding protein FerR (iron transport regulator)
MHSNIRNIIDQGKSPDASEEQQKELMSLFHQPDLEFDLKNHLLEDLIQTKAIGEDRSVYDDLFDKFWRKRKIEVPVKRLKKYLVVHAWPWAAILVIGLLLGYYIHTIQDTSMPVYFTSLSPKGSITEMYLPDGSHVYLNSGSELKYSINGTDKKREVFLKGEAWFQVAKMKEKPFLVHTPLYDVKVTGTIFNVKAYEDDNEVVTTLEEGGVKVISSENLQLGKDIAVVPGEQLVYTKSTNAIQIQQVNTKWYTSWKDNKLVFINMSVKELKVLLERKYGVNIEIEDESILKYHYDGTLKDETILEVLDIIKHTLPIEYKVVGQKIVISKNK